MPASKQLTSLELDQEERTLLMTLLERTLRETHSEARRTDALELQDQLHHEEACLRALIDKVRRA
jgi:hypothetical protein